jgi:hypothetical protein
MTTNMSVNIITIQVAISTQYGFNVSYQEACQEK